MHDQAPPAVNRVHQTHDASASPLAGSITPTAARYALTWGRSRPRRSGSMALGAVTGAGSPDPPPEAAVNRGDPSDPDTRPVSTHSASRNEIPLFRMISMPRPASTSSTGKVFSAMVM